MTLLNHGRKELRPIATQSEIEYLLKLPKNRSGKIIRGLLNANELGTESGDIYTLEE